MPCHLPSHCPSSHTANLAIYNATEITHIFTVSSSMPSFSEPSVEPSTSSTTPGSPLSSRRSAVVVKVASAPKHLPAVARKSTQPTRLVLLVQTTRLSQPELRPMTRAGSPRSICSVLRRSASGAEPQRLRSGLRWQTTVAREEAKRKGRRCV